MRVVIGEDEALMRAGLTLVLEDGGIEVVGSTDDASALVPLAVELGADVVVTDIRMPPTHTHDGLEAALRLRAAAPGTGVLVLSQFVQLTYAMELLEGRTAGVGYLLKQRVIDSQRFLADLHTVAGGGTVLDPEVALALVDRAGRRRGALDDLTPRQREVLAAMAEGKSNAAIARQLSIAEKTVVQHTSLIYSQMGIRADEDQHRRVAAVVRYLAEDL